MSALEIRRQVEAVEAMKIAAGVLGAPMEKVPTCWFMNVGRRDQ